MNEVQFLTQVLQAYSPSGQEQEVARVLEKGFSTLGFEVQTDAVGNVVATKGTGKKTLLFLGHMDTVPGEISVEEKEGKIFGRGAVDAKSSIVSFALAAAQAHVSNLKIVVCACVEEETPHSRGGRAIIKSHSPDFVVVGEPSGSSAVTIGYKGRANVTFHATTPMAHTAAKEKNALEHALNFWGTVKQQVDGMNKGKNMFEAIQYYPLDVKEKQEAFSHTATLEIGLRIPEGFDASVFENTLKTAYPHGEITVEPLEMAARAGKNNPLVRAYLQGIRSQSLNPIFKVKSGTSDFNIAFHAWKGVPILAYGPGDSSLDHTPKEHVYVKELLTSIAVTKNGLEELNAFIR